jgi:dynein heavy chain
LAIHKRSLSVFSVFQVYHACAERASVLFSVLNDMSQIDPMYQFSLDSYMSLFVLSIERSPKCQNFEDRVMALNDYHTYSVYRYSENLI